MGLTFTTAFIAGMLSFISPCILPLAPGYVAMISVVSVEELRERQSGIHWRVLLNALLFVLGFSVLFVALGASAGVAGRFLSAHRVLLNRIAGAVIVFFGAVLLGWIRIPALYRDKRFHGTIAAGKVRSSPAGIGICFWMDAMRGASARRHAHAGLNSTDRCPWYGVVERLLGWIGSTILACSTWNQQICVSLPPLAQQSGLGGTFRGRAADQRGSGSFL
jgi:Cytochrome C biogenesis protein transmembrane region